MPRRRRSLRLLGACVAGAIAVIGLPMAFQGSAEAAGSPVTVTVDRDRTVLEAVRAAGVEVLSSCRQGTCGTCETGVLAGVPDHRDSILGDDERAAGDCMFLCVSRSCSDTLVLDI